MRGGSDEGGSAAAAGAASLVSVSATPFALRARQARLGRAGPARPGRGVEERLCSLDSLANEKRGTHHPWRRRKEVRGEGWGGEKWSVRDWLHTLQKNTPSFAGASGEGGCWGRARAFTHTHALWGARRPSLPASSPTRARARRRRCAGVDGRGVRQRAVEARYGAACGLTALAGVTPSRPRARRAPVPHPPGVF